VTVTVLVRADGSDGRVPRGSVRFTASGLVLGTAGPDGDGIATLRTTALPPGEQQIVADYPGDDDFLPSRVVVRHRVE
jgi:hypothetical protein